MIRNAHIVEQNTGISSTCTNPYYDPKRAFMFPSAYNVALSRVVTVFMLNSSIVVYTTMLDYVVTVSEAERQQPESDSLY